MWYGYLYDKINLGGIINWRWNLFLTHLDLTLPWKKNQWRFLFLTKTRTTKQQRNKRNKLLILHSGETTEWYSNQLAVLLAQKTFFSISEILETYSCKNYGCIFLFGFFWGGFWSMTTTSNTTIFVELFQYPCNVLYRIVVAW